jgi:uncharacterized repeat protein (TIGR02543 family)
MCVGGEIAAVSDTDYCYDMYDATTVRITHYYGPMGDIVIPGTLDGYPVSELGVGAFQNRSLWSVTIPNSVTRIGGGAFFQNALTTVTIPDSVEVIGDDAFSFNNLTSVDLGEGVNFIGARAFFRNQLSSLVIPESMNWIGDSAFEENHLTSLDLGHHVAVIEAAAFVGNLFTTLTIPDSVITIGNDAFTSIPLTSLTLGSSVRTIGEYAFQGDPLGSVTLPASLQTIGAHAFFGTQLTTLTIPAGVDEIGDGAFDGNALTTVTMVGDEPATMGVYVLGGPGADNVGAFSDAKRIPAFSLGEPTSLNAELRQGRGLLPAVGQTGSAPSCTFGPIVSFHSTAHYTDGAVGCWRAGTTEYRVGDVVTVTFSSPQGTPPATVDRAVLDTLEGPVFPVQDDPGPVTATGWRFDGWFDAASAGSAIEFPITVRDHTTIYAYWTQLFDVTYTSARGTVPSAAVVPDGSSVADPGPLTATGWRFDGWFDAASGGAAVTFPLTVTANTNMYAHWTQLFDVTYASAHGTAPDPAVVPDGAEVANPGPLSATGYRFDGWFDAASGGAAVTFPLTVTADTDIYAHWTRMYAVTYTTAHSVAPPAATVPTGGSLADPGALGAAGYRFDGWFDVASGGTAVEFPLTVTADTHLFAHWTSLFTVGYTTAQSVAPSSVVIPNGDTVTDPGPLAATGYRFDGWYHAASGGTSVTFPLTVTADTDIYAHWTRMYDITYATSHSVAPSSVVVPDGGSLADPGSLTATGYRFDGWFDAASDGSAVTFPFTVTADTDIYAHWTRIFDVTYSTDHAVAPSAATVPTGTELANPGSLHATGFRFDGWYDAASGGNLVTFPLTISSDTALYAYWTPAYEVTYTSPVGTAPAPVDIAIGDTLTEPAPLVVDAHRFDGWYDAPTGGNPVAFPLTVTEDTQIYAHWVARQVAAPTDADKGDTITITGTGFEPGESVDVVLHSTPILLTTVIADGVGAIHVTVTIPTGADTGGHSLVLTGSVTGVSADPITINGSLASTGANPVLGILSALALIGIGLVLRMRAERDSPDA